MANEGSSSTLVLVAAILQLIFVFILAILAGLFGFVTAIIGVIPPSYLPPGFTVAEYFGAALGITIFLGVATILSLVFTILWFQWRHQPSQHKAGLIVSGIFGLLFTGFLPGLLALIGGAIGPRQPEYPPPPTRPQPKASPVAGVKYCSSCGTPVSNPNAEYCGICGASLN